MYQCHERSLEGNGEASGLLQRRNAVQRVQVVILQERSENARESTGEKSKQGAEISNCAYAQNVEAAADRLQIAQTAQICEGEPLFTTADPSNSEHGEA
jgi:hypothetical protein